MEMLLVSRELSLGYEPTSLRLSESAVQHSTHRATRVLRLRGRVWPGAYHTSNNANIFQYVTQDKLM